MNNLPTHLAEQSNAFKNHFKWQIRSIYSQPFSKTTVQDMWKNFMQKLVEEFHIR